MGVQVNAAGVSRGGVQFAYARASDCGFIFGYALDSCVTRCLPRYDVLLPPARGSLSVSPYTTIGWSGPGGSCGGLAQMGPLQTLDRGDAAWATDSVALNAMHNAALRTVCPGCLLRAAIRVIPQLNYFSAVDSTGISGLIFIFPLLLSFVTPTFVVYMVTERNTNLVLMMKIEGMYTAAYWCGNYVAIMASNLIFGGVYVILCYVAQLAVFTNASPALFLALLVNWGNTQAMLAFLVAGAVQRPRVASIVSYIFIVLLAIAAAVLANALHVWPTGLLLIPPISFIRCVLLILQFGGSAIVPGSDLALAMGLQFVGSLLLGGLGVYLHAVTRGSAQDGFGVPAELCFCLPRVVRRAAGHYARLPFSWRPWWRRPAMAAATDVATDLDASAALGATAMATEDADVARERAIVEAGEAPASTIVLLRGLRKVWRRTAAARVVVRH